MTYWGLLMRRCIGRRLRGAIVWRRQPKKTPFLLAMDKNPYREMAVAIVVISAGACLIDWRLALASQDRLIASGLLIAFALGRVRP